MFLKHQKIIVIGLSLIILLLGAGIYLNKNDIFKETSAPSNTNNYARIRNANLSLSSSLKWEQPLGGSEDEHLVNAFSINGKLYIFGNSTSNDYDMIGIKKGFIAILAKNGKTVNFLPISSTDIEIVSIAEGGFIIITAYPSCQAILVDYDGNILKNLPLFSREEKIEKIVLNDDGYSILSTSKTAGGKKILTVTLINKQMELIYQIVSNESYSMNPLDIYCIGNQTIVFSHAEGVDDRLAVGIFSNGASPIFRYITYNKSYIPFNVLPYKNGWVVGAIDNLGQAFLLKLSFSYTVDEKLLFNIGDCTKCKMIYSDDLYLIFASRNTGGFLAIVNNDISDSIIKTQSKNFTYFNEHNLLRALAIDDGILLGTFNKNDITITPLTSSTAFSAILVNEYLIFEGDGQFGKRDINVCLLNT